VSSQGSGALVVAAADQSGMVDSVAARSGLAGVVWHGRGPSASNDHARFATVAESLPRCRPSALVVLVPYRGLTEDLAAALGKGIPCLCAGPPETSPTRLTELSQAPSGEPCPVQCGGLLSAGAAFSRLRELSRRPAFGQAVYLRWLAGGGRGPSRAWWVLRDMVLSTIQILGTSPSAIWITASGHGRACQATATLTTDAGAMAQLTVCPQFLPGAGQISTLGTGGRLEFEGESGSRLVGPRGEGALDPSETEAGHLWLSAFEAGRVAQTPEWGDLPLLQALRRSLATGTPQAVSV